jgi:hypothetical protein
MPQENPPPEDVFELPIAGFQGTPEEIERQWFETVYRGRGDSMAQLTWRAVLMGLLLGALSSLAHATFRMPYWQSAVAVGGLVGILLPLLAKIFPKYEPWIPSAAGLGLAWTFQWYTSLLFFLGAVIGYGFEKTAPRQSKEFTFPVAFGIIAGGSLMAVFLIFWENGPQMLRQLLGK